MVKPKAKQPQPKKNKSSPPKSGVGAHGSRARPKTGEGGGKWPGGGKKGEDE